MYNVTGRLTQLSNDINALNPTPNTFAALAESLNEIIELNRREEAARTERYNRDVEDIQKLQNEVKYKDEQWKKALHQADPYVQMQEMIDNWCADNDCKPEDSAMLAREIVDSELADLFERCAKNNAEDWGRKRDWMVEMTVTYSINIEVMAKNREEAEKLAERECDNEDIDKDDLNYQMCEVDDAHAED